MYCYMHWWSLTPPFHPYQLSLAVYFLLHFPADCSGWALPTTLLCEVRTFLGALRQRGDPGDSSLANGTRVYLVVVRVAKRLVIAVTVSVVMMTAKLSSSEISGTWTPRL